MPKPRVLGSENLACTGGWLAGNPVSSAGSTMVEARTSTVRGDKARPLSPWP